MKRGERGQAITEYVLVVSLGLVMLAAPIWDGKSLVMRFVEVFDIYLDSFHTVIALPFP